MSLKSNPSITEAMIQDYIFNDPSVLGLGTVVPIVREKVQPAGGRLDLLLKDDDSDTRYEVEIQLGATDPSHIIRTIEYWDNERKRYPNFDHCAVIVAEEINSRFFNVISLFNGNIPLIAVQLSAYKLDNENVMLVFTRILDRVSQAPMEDEIVEPTDRAYWEKNASSKFISLMDKMFSEIPCFTQGYALKYNKRFIGIQHDGRAHNFVIWKPKRDILRIEIFCTESEEINLAIEHSNDDLDAYYNARIRGYTLRLNSSLQYEKN